MTASCSAPLRAVRAPWRRSSLAAQALLLQSTRPDVVAAVSTLAPAERRAVVATLLARDPALLPACIDEVVRRPGGGGSVVDLGILVGLDD